MSGAVLADSYQLYMPGQSSFVNNALPQNMQKLWILNTDSNIVKEVSMVNYFGATFPNNNSNLYSQQIDFRGSTRVAQDFVGSTLTLRDNSLVNLASLTTDVNDPLFGQAFYYDRVVKINVNTGELEADYLVARSELAKQVADDIGFETVLADGAGEIIPGFDTLTLKTFSKNETTSTGSLATDGGFFAEQITSSNGASLFRQEEDGTVHIGENSIVLADELVSQSGYDEIYSSSGVLQLGNNDNHKTIIKGELELQGNLSIKDPTAAGHAATKRYVDGAVATSMAMASIPKAMHGMSMIGVGTGYHAGQSAIAVGLSSHNARRNIIFNASVGYNTNIKAKSISAGFGWGF
jgi:hypothetical protein